MTSSNQTVVQLKEQIRQLGFKPPNVNKARLIHFRRQAEIMKERNIPQTIIRKGTPSYTAVYPNTLLSFNEHLETYGWGVCSVDIDCDRVVNELLSWLSEQCHDFDVSDPATWTRKNMPYNLHGIFKHWVGHHDTLWQARETCHSIFSSLWEDDDLLSSFDGFGFLPSLASKRSNHWMHSDQDRFKTARENIQGVLNLCPNGPNDGGTLLMQSSHQQFTEYIERHPVDGIDKFFPIDIDDASLSACPIVKPCLNPGDVLCWDSRVFHCNTPPLSSNMRMCIYISMQPRSGASSKELEKRIRLAEQGRMTGHWCYGPELNLVGKEPNPMHSTGLPHPTTLLPRNLTPLQRRMIGYSDTD